MDTNEQTESTREAVPLYIEDEQPTERLPVRERWSTEEMMELVKGSRP